MTRNGLWLAGFIMCFIIFVFIWTIGGPRFGISCERRYSFLCHRVCTWVSERRCSFLCHHVCTCVSERRCSFLCHRVYTCVSVLTLVNCQVYSITTQLVFLCGCPSSSKNFECSETLTHCRRRWTVFQKVLMSLQSTCWKDCYVKMILTALRR